MNIDTVEHILVILSSETFWRTQRNDKEEYVCNVSMEYNGNYPNPVLTDENLHLQNSIISTKHS